MFSRIRVDGSEYRRREFLERRMGKVLRYKTIKRDLKRVRKSFNLRKRKAYRYINEFLHRGLGRAGGVEKRYCFEVAERFTDGVGVFVECSVGRFWRVASVARRWGFGSRHAEKTRGTCRKF